MTNEDFVRVAKTAAASHTMYASGTFGQLFSEAFIKQKQSQYPLWYSPYRVDAIRREAASGPLYLFDCCGLIKAIIWNWPNTKYASNNLPDVNDSGIWTKYCYDCSSDFSSIVPGEIMHMPAKQFISAKEVKDEMETVTGYQYSATVEDSWTGGTELKIAGILRPKER